MEQSQPDNPDLIQDQTAIPHPVVLVIIDSWGIAPQHSGNVFTNLKLKTLSSLVKNYPIALLSAAKKNPAQRYESIGASGVLSEKIANLGFSQLNLTESEKVTLAWHYLNNGRDKLYNKEELKVISSKLGNRETDPKQSIPDIMKIALRDIKRGLHDFLIISLSNLDLVSATGNLDAAKDATKILDKNLGRLVDAVLKQKGLLIITAAYGHAEAMINEATELPESGVTENSVPFIIVGAEYEGKNIGLPDTLDSDLSLVETVGTLDDVTPTIFKILNITPPDSLSGKSLI